MWILSSNIIRNIWFKCYYSCMICSYFKYVNEERPFVGVCLVIFTPCKWPINGRNNQFQVLQLSSDIIEMQFLLQISYVYTAWFTWNRSNLQILRSSSREICTSKIWRDSCWDFCHGVQKNGKHWKTRLGCKMPQR